MTLDELARAAPVARQVAVPAWTLGCFHRRCITYATGAEDTTTLVVWIQSHGLTGDIRIAAGRADVSHRGGLGDCTIPELDSLLHAEGGVAETSWADGLMSWDNWVAFQPYDKWPEPGALSRVGACLIEFAPSGAYVEDWRLQPGSDGLLVGLRLETENGRSRDGGLVIAGRHAILSLGRRAPLPAETPAPVQFRATDDPYALAAAAFDAITWYAQDGVVVASTDPFAHGDTLDLEGFEAAEPGYLIQTLTSGGVRRWRIDTLLADQAIASPTAADPAGAAWIAEEGARLPGLA